MKRLIFPVVAFLVLCALPAVAAEVKIGFVDLQRALNQSDAGLQAKEEIGKKVKVYEAEITGRQEELKKLQQELEKQAVLLAESVRAEKEREYQKKLKELQRQTKDIQEELQQKDADFTRGILEQLLEVVKQIGAEQGLTLILEKTESSVLYADDRIDLTDAVIAAFNKILSQPAQ